MLKDKKHTNQLIRPPRIGQVKVGEKTEKGYPTSTDYFIIDSDYADKVKAVYGEKPKALKIFFPFDNIEDNLDEMYRYYGSSGIKCKGDGETFMKFDETMTLPPKCPCDFAEPPEGQKQQCFPSMIMAFVIKGIGITGVWHFSSKSIYSRNNVRASMLMVKEVSGKLAGMPFILRVEMRKSATAGSSHVFPVISVDCEMDIEKLAEKQLQITDKPENIKELIAPVTKDREQKKDEPESKFAPAIQTEWDAFHKWIEDNKDKLAPGTYNTAIIWLNGLEKPTVEKLLKNLALIKSQIKIIDEPTGEYRECHESLITNCCEILKTKDRLPVIQTLDNMVKKWGIDGIEKLSDTSENQCLNLVDAFDNLQREEDEADLPY